MCEQMSVDFCLCQTFSIMQVCNSFDEGGTSFGGSAEVGPFDS